MRTRNKVLTAFGSLALAGALATVPAASAHASLPKPCQVQVYVTPFGVDMPAQHVSVGQVLTLVGSVPAESFTVTSFGRTNTGAIVMTTAPTFPASWDNTNPALLTGNSCHSHH